MSRLFEKAQGIDNFNTQQNSEQQENFDQNSEWDESWQLNSEQDLSSYSIVVVL